MYETQIPVENIVDEDELRALINQLARVTGRAVQIVPYFIISTDDPTLSAMLDTLRDTMLNGKHVPAKKIRIGKRIKKVKGKDEPKPEPTRGPHVRSIKINGNGEMISRFELNKRLVEHTITAGTVLHSPKYGKLIVKNGGSENEPLTLVDESGNPI